MVRSCKVAVIGAGAAGLVTARELQREGHRVVIFEKAGRLGGTWVYDPCVDSDPMGLDPDREVVHGSLYESLRTNLPREIMGFSDYPFEVRKGRDSRRFPGHEEVLSYLEDFAEEFGLAELTRFGVEVVRVRMGEKRDEWVVNWRRRSESGAAAEAAEEIFEAVVVCNGHYTEPQIAQIPGIEKWPGKQIHSHNYRVPEPFRDQVVVLIGSGPSALDISRDVAKVAKEVHLASRSPNVEVGHLAGHDNIWQHLMIGSVNEDGTLVFEDGTSLLVDTLLYCTGYKYQFPFLEMNGVVGVDDNRVGPLYKHVYPPSLAPWLSFVGLPSKVIPFLNMELQAKWIAHTLSGKIALPTEEEMMASVEDYYTNMEKTDRPKHYTHVLHPFEFEYKSWLLAQVGLPPVEPWIEETYWNALKSLLSKSDVIRD